MDEDTEIYKSCSAILNGEYFVFGGTNGDKRRQVLQSWAITHSTLIDNNPAYFQVSKVIGCGLKRIGDLSYEFHQAACGTFLFPQERILLCFAESYRSKCER